MHRVQTATSDENRSCSFQESASVIIMANDQVKNDAQTTNSQSNQQNSEDGQVSNQQNSFETDSIKLRNEMATLLAAVDHRRVNACNISLVPEQLRKSNTESYTPQVVSIGPVHRGAKTNLLYMEEIKWQCMKHLFKRTNFNNEEKCLLECTRQMWKMDEMVRASYVDPIKFNRNDLIKILILDGCFLLELLLSGSPKLSQQITRSLDPEAGAKDLGPSPGAEVIKREDVLSDLTLLENQLPFIVLDQLLEVLFGEYYDMGGKKDFTDLIYKCSLSMLGYSYSSVSLDSGFKAFNLVELVHSFIDKENHVHKENNDTERGKVGDKKLKLGRCATRLEAAGVKISGLKGHDSDKNKNPKRFDLRIKFNEGKLEIPQLHITRTTEAKWRNLIAWEVNRTSLDIHRGRKEAKTRCQFISYAWFFQNLICCVHDVKLLRDREVISVDEVKTNKGQKKIMSDEALLKLFRKMTEGVSDAEIEMDPRFVDEIRNLNSFNGATKTGRVIWHFLRRFLTWIWKMCIYSFWGLIAAYFPTGWTLIAVLGAMAGLALTAAQTAYAIMGK